MILIWVILTNFELVKRNIIDVKFLATLNETSPQGFRKECKMLESQDFLKNQIQNKLLQTERC